MIKNDGKISHIFYEKDESVKMSGLSPPDDIHIYRTQKRRLWTLDIDDLLKVLLYTIMLKKADLTPEQNAGKEVQDEYDALPDELPKKATFFWDQPVKNLSDHAEYLQLTYKIMYQVDEDVRSLYQQLSSDYLLFICKICELFGVPPDVLEVQPKTTILSKVADLLQYLHHRSQTFNIWTISCLPQQTLQNMKQYRRLLQFLERVVSDRTFALCEENYRHLQIIVKSLENPIDLSTFFSILEGPSTDRYILTWMNTVMSEMVDVIRIEDCLEQIPKKFQKKIVKLWTIVHKKLSAVSAEEALSEQLLVFLVNVLPSLVKTKYFMIDCDLFASVRELVTNLLGTLTEEQYSDFRCGKNEKMSVFLPEDFTSFSSCLLKAIGKRYDDLHDVKNLQDDSDVTLESLIAVHSEKKNELLCYEALMSLKVVYINLKTANLLEHSSPCKLTANDDLVNALRGQALDLSIFEIFSRICQELKLPAKLLVPNNFPETISNVFLFIIHLSDRIRSMDHRKEKYLEIIQDYKKIANFLCNLKLVQHLFEYPSDLESFFQLVDKKLTASGKPSLANHDVSSLNELFISPDFVFAGFSSHLPESDDLLRLLIGALMRRFEEDKLEAKKYLYALCDIFHEIKENMCFDMDIFKFNVLCKILPWKEFTDFLQRLGNPSLCNELGFICATLIDMAKSVQENKSDDMDEHYFRVLSNHSPRGFEMDRTQILDFVCSQLSNQAMDGFISD